MARDLEARDPALALREHVAIGERVAGLALHEGDADFRQARVGVAHDRDQVDSGEAHQERLDLHGVDVLAADLEHVLVTAHEAQVAVTSHDAHVARVQPALAVERVRGLGGLSVVALHGHVAPHEDLAGHSRRLIQPARGIDDSDLVARRREAGRLGALLLGRVERAERCSHPELAHPVSREEPAEHLARLPGDGHGARHSGGKDAGSNARHVSRKTLVRLHQFLEVRVEPVEDRGALLLDEGEALRGVEGLGEHLARARHHRHERAVGEAEKVEQRQVHHDRIRRRDGHPKGPIDEVTDDRVVVHRPLGEPRRAGRVHEERGRVGTDLLGAGAERGLVDGIARRLRRRPVKRFRARLVTGRDDQAQGPETILA